MANATSTQLQELYVAYFGRAADPTGLDYWTEKGITTAKFAADMYAQNEFKSAYGSLSTESQVNQIYKNLFDREADVTGLTYWTQEINLGNLQLAEIATHLIWAAQNNSGSEDDKTALTNKTNAAVAYTAKVKESTSAILAFQAESTSPWKSGVNIEEAVSYLSGINKTTAHTAAGVATSVTTITSNGVPSAATTVNLTSGIDKKTGGAGADVFKGTDVTLQASDVIDGGAGSDTIEFVDSSTSGTAFPNVSLTSVENVIVRNLSGTAAKAATTEVTDVTFKAVPGYESVTVAGLTFTAGLAGATAAQVATAFNTGAADTSDAGGASGAVMSGTITSGFTAASGGNSTTTTFTAGSTGAVTDLTATGTATTATENVTVLTLAITPGQEDNTVKVTVNDTIIQSEAATAESAAGLSVIGSSLAANINAHVGDQVAFWDGEARLILTKGTSATNFTTVGTTNTTTGTFSAAPTVSSYVLAIVPGATSADTTAAYVNGQVIGTATLAGNSLDAAGAALVTSINNYVGRTVASYTDGTNTLAIDGVGEPILISNVAIGTATPPLGDTPTYTTTILGASAAAAPTINVTTQGAAAVAAMNTSNTQTVDTSNFSGVTSYKNFASSAAVKFTGITTNDKTVVESVTAGTGATTDAQYAAAVVKGTSSVGTLELKNNTSAGTITIGDSSGTGFETLNITATGKNTIGGSGIVSKGAKAVTLSADAATDVIISSDVASKGTLTVTGAGKVTLNTLDTAFDTVDASGNSGGIVVTDVGDTGTVYTLGSGDDKFTTAADGFATANKFAVAAGDGTDELVLAASADLDATTEGSRYTGFEKLTTGDWNQDTSLVSGITSLKITGTTTNRTISKINATAAQDITLDTTNATALTLSLANVTGSSDTVTIDLKSSTSTTNVDLVAVKVAGVETLNVKGSTGTSGTDSDITLGASGADKLTAVNLSGTADMTFNADNSAKAITLNSTSTGDITVTGAFVKASKVTTLAGADAITLGSNLGVTYDSGAGNDTFTTAEFSYLVATGSDDHVIKAGAGTDTLDIDKAAPVIIDNHMTNVTGLEKLTFAATGDYSITTGAAFKTAFTDSLSITSGDLSDQSSFVYAGGLYDKNTTITLDGDKLVGNATGENITITTGAGSDTVKLGQTTSWLGVANANGSAITISTGAGDDTIEFGLGILATQTITAIATITGGKGVDKITRGGAGVNSATDTTGVATFVFADGDSVVGAYDTITGYVNAESTSSQHGDILNIGTGATVGTSIGTADFGTLKSHSLINGEVAFDDAATYSAAVVINSSNLSDATGYLNANLEVDTTVTFEYDTTNDGSADSTFVYTNLASTASSADTLILLKSELGSGLTATASSTADNYIVIG